MLKGSHSPLLISSAQVFAIRVAGAGLTYVSMVLLARWLGTFSFGIFANVFVAVNLIGLVLSLGFSTSALRFIPEYIARRKKPRLKGFLILSYATVLGLSIAGSLLVAGALSLGSSRIDPLYLRPLFIGIVCVPFWSVLLQGETTARAFGWVTLAYAPGYILRPVLVIAFVAIGVGSGFGPDAVLALIATTAACAAAGCWQAWRIFRSIARESQLAGLAARLHPRRWLATSATFLLIDVCRTVLDNADILIVGKLLDPASVAIYYAVVRSSGLITFAAFSVIARSVPRFAELHSAGTRVELQTFVTSTAKLVFWPSLAMALVFAVIGREVLRLFGPDFVAGYPTMLVVLAGLVLRSATLSAEHLLNATGYHRDTFAIYAGAALVSVALSLVLTPSLGIMGAALASYIGMIGGNLVLSIVVWRRLGIVAFVIPRRLKDRRLSRF